MSTAGFREILAGATRAEEEAWRTLYRDLAPAVIGFLGAVGAGNGAEAEADRLFARLGELLPSFKGGERELRSLVFSLARNEGGDHPSRLAVSGLLSSRSDPLAPGELKVRRIVDLLPADEREALLLCVLGQLSVEEAARILEAPSATLVELLHRSLLSVAGEISRGAVAVPVVQIVAGLSRDEVEQLIAGRSEGGAELDELRVFLISLKSAFYEIPSQEAEARHVGMAVAAARSATAPSRPS